MSEEIRITGTDEEPRGIKGFLADVMDIAEAVVVTFFLFFLIFAYLFRPVTVSGDSMNPTLLTEDKILIVSPLYQPKNGQVVVIDNYEAGLFSDPDQKEIYRADGSKIILVKRLIARGGQTIDIDFEKGIVTVDGQQLDEPYIAEATRSNGGAFQYPLTVPEGYMFVMGDNRNESMDSRSPNVALIPEDELLGTAVVRYNRDEDDRDSFKERFDYLF